MNQQKTSDIAVHGLLLWASTGFLMPLGILLIRGSIKAEPGSRRSKLLFYLHVAFQVISLLFLLVKVIHTLPCTSYTCMESIVP